MSLLDSGTVAATWDIHSLLQGGRQCLTHVAYGNYMPGLAAVEMHQGSGLTRSVKLVSEKTSQEGGIHLFNHLGSPGPHILWPSWSMSVLSIS